MKKISIISVIIGILSFFCCQGGYPEVICLKNGKSFEVIIVHKSEQYLEVDISGVRVKYYLDEVQSIEGKDVAAPVPQPVVVPRKETEISLSISAGAKYDLDKELYDSIMPAIKIMYVMYHDMLGLTYPERLAVKINIFGDFDEFERLQQKKYQRIISRSGFYASGDNQIYVWQGRTQDRMLRVIFHEMSHLFINVQGQALPEWLNEGLGEFFEGMYWKDNLLGVWLPRECSSWCKQKAQEKGFHISSYFSMTKKEWDTINESTRHRAYKAAQAIVYFLMLTEQRREVLKKITEYVRGNPASQDLCPAAFNLYYPGGIAQFDKDWYDWILATDENTFFVFDITAAQQVVVHLPA